LEEAVEAAEAAEVVEGKLKEKTIIRY